ncbi:uncharacterized protein PV09_00733 [Verruconis gallopava]|uniref:Uncharacterized protein n=1 Tax=Verruconis gallopava TaxID=253628 RepID=A0A0D2BBP7_9PEZI|nr:uncharacterized protein PV09_00733 [Verruconis gallopava]KIW08799.1 hypothetical protein PV09_00733 [Verruconis gallopava]
MNEKAELARQINLDPHADSDSDSDFEEREEIFTPRTSINGTVTSDLPPTYEESEALARSRTEQQTARGIENHSDITVYRTEIPPDPPIQVVRPSSEEKQSSSPHSPGPSASALLNAALRFTENPPPTAERPGLRSPVAVPSFAGNSPPAKFARFYSPALYPQSITDGEFIEFIDGLNSLSIASGFSASTYHSRSSLTASEVPRDEEALQGDDLVSAYIALSNSHFFNPRGLQVQLADLSELADILNISNAAIRKAVITEVLRMSKASIEVPAAANGAAHEAAGALVPYIEPLITAVPEPKKNQEALLAVASRFAALDIAARDMSAPELARENTSASSSSGTVPPRTKSWGEWGSDIGKFWEDMSEKQSQFWTQWGEEKGRKWGRWGEEFGRRVEQMASGPPAWLAGSTSRACLSHAGACNGAPWGRGASMSPFDMRAGHWPGHGGHRGGWGARTRSFPWTPPGVSLPFQMPSHHGPHHMPPPPSPGGPPITPFPPQPPMVPGSVPHMPPHPPVPPMPGAFPTPLAPFTHPNAQSKENNANQPTRREDGSGRTKDADEHDDDDDDDDFADVADTLSLSSFSSSSSSDSEKTFVHDDGVHSEHEAIFAQKAEAIEKMAAEARAKNQKSASEIELERSRAMMELEHEYSRREMRANHRAQKRELKKDIHAWKKSLKKEFKASKSMDKAQRKEWKRTRKGEWKAFKAQLKEQHRAMKEERRAKKREIKELARAAKREGKKKDWENKRAGWDERRREWEERRAGGRRRGGRRGGDSGLRGGSRGFGGSAETLDEDVETQARQMLWIVVTRLEQ